MWCLIRFHWAVCHYFISRAICWPSLCRRKKTKKKPARLRGEQQRRRCESSRSWWRGRRGRDWARRCGGDAGRRRRCCYLTVSWGWQYLLEADRRRMNSNVPLPGWLCVSLSSARLAQRGGVSAATQQEALCVCVCARVLWSIHRESTLFAVQCAYRTSICPEKDFFFFFLKG